MDRVFENDVDRLRTRAEAIKLSEKHRLEKPGKRELHAAFSRISDTGIAVGVTREDILGFFPDSVKTFAELERWEKKVKEIIMDLSPDTALWPQVSGSHKGFLKAARIARASLKEEVLGRIAEIY